MCIVGKQIVWRHFEIHSLTVLSPIQAQITWIFVQLWIMQHAIPRQSFLKSVFISGQCKYMFYVWMCSVLYMVVQQYFVKSRNGNTFSLIWRQCHCIIIIVGFCSFNLCYWFIHSFLSFIHLPNHLLIYSMNACLTLLIHQIQFRTHLLIFFIPAFNYSFITLYYQYT